MVFDISPKYMCNEFLRFYAKNGCVFALFCNWPWLLPKSPIDFPIGANVWSIHLLVVNYLLFGEAYDPIVLIVMQWETLNTINHIFVIKFANFPIGKHYILQAFRLTSSTYSLFEGHFNLQLKYEPPTRERERERERESWSFL